jgi:hypothetical protein
MRTVVVTKKTPLEDLGGTRVAILNEREREQNDGGSKHSLGSWLLAKCSRSSWTTMSPIPSLLDLAVVALCSTTSLWLYYRRPQISRRAYFVENIVTHARLLPVESQHAFTYPAIALLLSVNDLESRKLNTGLSWLFGYGGGPRLLSLRPQPYLTPDDDLSILEKLDRLLQKRGYPGAVEDVWMLTMPRILGFEGTNPLTVYWCYKPDGEPWLTVLEVCARLSHTCLL